MVWCDGPGGTPEGNTVQAVDRDHPDRQDKAMQDKLAEQGATPLTATPLELAASIRTDTEKWARLMKDSGATLELKKARWPGQWLLARA
jgi:tripartite-type tricarboxylate transporter receptor subunit TctC